MDAHPTQSITNTHLLKDYMGIDAHQPSNELLNINLPMGYMGIQAHPPAAGRRPR